MAGVLLLNGCVWPELVYRIPRGFKCRFLNAARRRVQLGVQRAASWAGALLQMADAVRGRIRPDPLDGSPHLVPDLRCHVYQMNDSKLDHRDARDARRGTLLETPPLD